MKKIVLIFGSLLFSSMAIVAAAVLDPGDGPPPWYGLDDTGSQLNISDTLKFSEEEQDAAMGDLNSIADRKVCKPTISCIRAGGYCVKKNNYCKGTLDGSGCKGNKCKCCIPEWCPSPYRIRGTECFFVSEDKNDLLNWDEALQRCLSMGGVLAQPQDMVDFVNYIKSSYPNSKSTIWLGATDREVEQKWYWLSGEPVPSAMWTPWPDNQPSGDGNCMEIHWWSHTSFYMNDWYCHNKGHFACEINSCQNFGNNDEE